MPGSASVLSLACLSAAFAFVLTEAAPLVTCGSLIKLQHVSTNVNLHSHEISYGSGSGQQSVTGFTGGDDANDYWAIKAAVGLECHQGTPIKSGSKLGLYHTTTQKWLHSHHFSSPLTGSQEVSAFGSAERSDTGDAWLVEWDKAASAWEQDQVVRFKHVDTGVYLSSHTKTFSRPITGQQEVCGKAKSKDANWKATEGVFFPERSSQ